MCPAISSTSSFPTLLLVLLSLRPGLQYPTPSQHWNTDMCNDTIRELFQELERLTEKSDSPGVEVQMLLCNNSLWRNNLCEFLSAIKTFPNATEKLKNNLEYLRVFVPASYTQTMRRKKSVTFRNWNDFGRKLHFFLRSITCTGSKSVQSTTSLSLECGFVPEYSSENWQCLAEQTV